MGRTYIALDTETTGLDSERDSIIEIAAVKFRDGEVLDTWSSLVNPKRPLPYKIQQLTGITPEDLQGAPPLPAVLSPLSRFAQGHPVVGHNIPFDLAFLRRHNVLMDNPSLDTFALASILLPKAPRYSLDVLTQLLGIQLTEHHRALADAIAVKDLFLALFERGQEMDLRVLQEINRMAAHSRWPLGQFFVDLERERAQVAFGSTMREQLLSKGSLDGDALGLVLDRRDRPEPLRPAETRQVVDAAALTSMLLPGGLIADGFPGYEHRPQQITMLESATEAFNEGYQLIIEAGTGTGKSLAYLLPAIHYAVKNSRPVVISTNTINLQDQLYNKDIPDLRALLPFPFQAAVLKGRGNYLCLRRLAQMRKAESLDANEAQVLAKILAWLPETPTGDNSELALRELEFAVWTRVQAEQETCLGDRCPHLRKGRCFFYHARHNAESAHLIIINHALLLSDMLVANRILPEYRHLIVDEAHHLEARATEQLGFSISRNQLHGLLSGLYQPSEAGQPRGFLAGILGHFRGSTVDLATQKDLAQFLQQLQSEVQRAEGASAEFFEALQVSVGEQMENEPRRGSPQYDRQIELTYGVRSQPSWSDVEVCADNLDAALLRIEQGLAGLQQGLTQVEDEQILDYDNLLQEVIARLDHVRQWRHHLQSIVIEPNSRGIYWFSVSLNNGGVTLNYAPLEVGELLVKNLFANMETIVLTSATLRTEGNFNYIRERIGLPDASELVVGSPFDYVNSTLLYLPTDIPEPSQPNYQSIVGRAITELCLATGGRSLLLFTSHSQLQSTYRTISRPLEDAGIITYGQGLDGSRRQLLENFRNTPKSVLLGTRSFWEGIDVVGSALSCLVIARLPFAVPTDPVFAARSRTFDDPFGQYAVPEAVLRFRQGFGRLIRSCSDRGVVVVLDKRILSKSYGSAFLDSLPECTIRRGPLGQLPAAAAAWIRQTQGEKTTLS